MSDELLIPEADIAMAARKIVQAGRKTKRRNTGPTLTLGTIKAVHDYDGNMVADVTVRGADLLGLDMTVDCVNAQPGDRCVIQEQAHHAMVTGILAKPGAWVPVTHREQALFQFQDTGSFQGVEYGGGNAITIDHTLRLLYVDLQSFYSTVQVGNFPVWFYKSGPKPSESIWLGSIANVSGNRYGKQGRWDTNGQITLIGGLGNGDNIHTTQNVVPIPDGVTFN